MMPICSVSRRRAVWEGKIWRGDAEHGRAGREDVEADGACATAAENGRLVAGRGGGWLCRVDEADPGRIDAAERPP